MAAKGTSSFGRHLYRNGSHSRVAGAAPITMVPLVSIKVPGNPVFTLLVRL